MIDIKALEEIGKSIEKKIDETVSKLKDGFPVEEKIDEILKKLTNIDDELSSYLSLSESMKTKKEDVDSMIKASNEHSQRETDKKFSRK